MTTASDGRADGYREEQHEVRITASLDAVWERLTTGAGLSSWFGTDGAIEAARGGRVRISWGDDQAIVGRVDALDARRRLRIVHLDAEGNEIGAEEWLLAHEGGTTTLRMIHSMPDPGVDDWDGWYGDIRRGYTLFLRLLRFALEDAPRPDRVASCRYVRSERPREDLWPAIIALRDVPPAGLAGRLRVLLADPPHTLLLAADATTVAVDQEGAAPTSVYVEVAGRDHSAGGRAAVDAVLDEVAGRLRTAVAASA